MDKCFCFKQAIVSTNMYRIFRMNTSKFVKMSILDVFCFLNFICVSPISFPAGIKDFPGINKAIQMRHNRGCLLNFGTLPTVHAKYSSALYCKLKSSALERTADQCTTSTTVQLGSRTIQQCIWVHLTAAFLTLLFVWKSLIEAPVAFVPRPKKGRCRYPGESLCSRISWQKRIYWHTKKDILEELPSLGECSYNCSDKLWYR